MIIQMKMFGTFLFSRLFELETLISSQSLNPWLFAHLQDYFVKKIHHIFSTSFCCIQHLLALFYNINPHQIIVKANSTKTGWPFSEPKWDSGRETEKFSVTNRKTCQYSFNFGANKAKHSFSYKNVSPIWSITNVLICAHFYRATNST